MEKTLSKYGRRFDKTCSQWKNDKIQNRMTIRYYERYFDDLLSIRGYVFLRDIYEAFGIPITEESILVGWYYDENNPIGDNFIEFNVIEGSDYFDIDFNVDGNISNKF